LGLAAAGCSLHGPKHDEDRAETVVFDLEGRVVAPDLWNPYVPGARLDQGLQQALIEPMFLLNTETGEIEPWLGLSMTSNEPMDVWTLTMRPGVKWNDGAPFTADDVVFTINLLLENGPSLLLSGAMQQWVARVEKVDDLTVRFHLAKPNPRFKLDYWSVKIYNSIYILPEHIWKGKDPFTFKNYEPGKGWPVFTGPYKLDRFNETTFVYRRDEQWWGAQTGWKPLPAPKSLEWVSHGSEEMRTAAMVDGSIDSLCDITLGAYQALEHFRGPEVMAWTDGPPYVWLDPCPRALEFNCQHPPWNDKEIRWAVNYCIDRDMIVAVAYEGTSAPSRHFFPAYPPLERYFRMIEENGAYERHPVWDYNPEKARAIFESKGYHRNRYGYFEKDGQELSVTITTHEAAIELQRVAQVLVEQLQNAGIDASNRNEAGGTWMDNGALGAFDAHIGWMACGSMNEPWSTMDTFNASWMMPEGQRAQFNIWRWKNLDYSALVDAMGRLPLGDPRIDDLYRRAMEIWLDELPAIPLTQARKLLPFAQDRWTNWPSKQNPYMHPCTWWQSTCKMIHEIKPVPPKPGKEQ